MTESATAEKKKINRKPVQFVLVWINQTEYQVGDDETHETTCFVQVPMPEGLSDKQLRDRAAIMRAAKKAGSQGNPHYANRDFVVMSYGEQFSCPYQPLPDDPEALKAMVQELQKKLAKKS